MMLALEDVFCELIREDTNEQGLPPGFRFHPTDEELITFYLASKVFNASFSTGHVSIAEVDLNRCEPWELPDVAKMGEREWYLYSLRDRKYPTGLRTNRATGAGYWKATGKDREVYSASNGVLLGMKKTLVFYRGRAPRGEKTKWVMHEYRLDGDFSSRHTCKEEWVICRIYHKNMIKRNPMFQGQSYLMESCSSPIPSSNNNTTGLVEYESHAPMQYHQSIHENPFMIQEHENEDLKSLINPYISISHQLNNDLKPILINEASFSPPTTKSSSREITTSISKLCKTELIFSQFELHDPAHDNLNLISWMDKIHEPFLNPLSFEMGSAAAHDSTTIAATTTNRDGFYHPPNRLLGDAWPLDHNIY